MKKAKNIVLLLVMSIVAVAGKAQSKPEFSTDKFDNFTLHTYAGFDAMANVSFIVEGKTSLVILEPQAFKENIQEFVNYTKALNKPIEKVLVSFHGAGLKVYENEEKVITKPMEAFMNSDAAKGMLNHFDKAFKGAMDTEVVSFDEQIDANTKFTVDDIQYVLEPTSVPGMPGVNIAIGTEVYYQHFSPNKGFHASKNQIKSRASIDGALVDAIKAKKGKFTLLIGSHGLGKADNEDLNFQIKYLKTMKKIVSKATSSDEFIVLMNKIYPDCKGDIDLKEISTNLYK